MEGLSGNVCGKLCVVMKDALMNDLGRIFFEELIIYLNTDFELIVVSGVVLIQKINYFSFEFLSKIDQET